MDEEALISFLPINQLPPPPTKRRKKKPIFLSQYQAEIH